MILVNLSVLYSSLIILYYKLYGYYISKQENLFSKGMVWYLLIMLNLQFVHIASKTNEKQSSSFLKHAARPYNYNEISGVVVG